MSAITVTFGGTEVTAEFADLSVPVTIGGGVSVPVAFTVAGPAGTNGAGLPSGGATGAIPRKASGTDYDFELVTTLEDNAITIDGGLI